MSYDNGMITIITRISFQPKKTPEKREQGKAEYERCVSGSRESRLDLHLQDNCISLDMVTGRIILTPTTS